MTNTRTPIRTALVIGGGVAGPVTALALRKVGIEATVYEAYPPQSVGIGGGLGLAPNGMAALEIVGAADAVRAIASPMPNTRVTLGGRTAATMGTLPGVEPLRFVMRGALHQALHDTANAADVPYAYGKRLIAAEEHGSGDGGVTAHFADGTSATADILIGADGVRSTVRTLIDPDAPGPKYTGMIGFGAYGLDLSLPPDIDAEPGTMVFAFGKRAYYLYWRDENGLISWGANLPWTKYLTIGETRDIPAQQWLETLRATYGDDVPGRQFVAATSPEMLEPTGGLHIMPPVPHWRRGRMVLVGDAVHAPSNSTGQGASLAIESAVQLARCLRDLPDHTSAFAAYEQLRRPRVERIAAQGARVNHAKAPGPVAKVFMRALMPIMFSPAIVERTAGKSQRYRIDFDEKVSDETAAVATAA
jgi:2-polyprenyl-6-methoxyphenol hydroxylase-like FAD-dependent oxidoreductase